MAHCTPPGSLDLEVYNELSALGCPLYTPAPDPSSGLEPLSPKFGVQICLKKEVSRLPISVFFIEKKRKSLNYDFSKLRKSYELRFGGVFTRDHSFDF